MLTIEILRANAALSALTDEQIGAITTLSQNDENSVIAKKTGEIYGALDADILAASGIPKNGAEKTYDYAKRVMASMKAGSDKAEEAARRAESLEKEKARLEKAIAEGSGGVEAAKALKQARADLASVTAQYADLTSRFEQEKERHGKELFGARLDAAIREASAGVKLKAGFPESVARIVMQQAAEKVKAMNPEEADDGKGGKTLVFKGADGSILRNPGNQLNPFTAAELMRRELDGMGALDKGRQAAGGGTRPFGAGGGAGIDVSGARTRTEAYDTIRAGLMAQGLTAGSKAFEEAMQQAWKDNDVAALPEK